MAQSSSDFRGRDFLAIKFWPVWMLLGLLWLFAQLPYAAQMWLGRRIGELLGAMHGSRRQIAQTNINLCFPELTVNARRKILRDQFRALGMGVFEMGALWFYNRDKLRRRVRVTGLEHLQQAQALGKGVIVLQAHFTTLELGANLLALEYTMDANYDPPKNALYAAFLLHQRKRNFVEMIDNRSVRRLARRLREGHAIWYSPDQYVKPKRGGVATQFFARDTKTTDATSRIAKLTGAAVVPFLPVRTSKHGHYELRLLPALNDFPGEDTVADTQRINDLFEAHIREFPQQYFWVHKRFKRSNPNAKDYYA
ncbi:MAG: lipid A biosynthesis lauroyl acyltransferase [Pseudomonadota bacterium]